jgi:hypothetical protein
MTAIERSVASSLTAFKQIMEQRKISPLMTIKEEILKYWNSSDLHRGNLLVYNMRLSLAKLDRVDKFRSKDQREIHEILLAASCGNFYKELIRLYSREICDHNGFEDLRQVLFITMPRRTGKTASVADYFVCMLMNVPKITISVIAPGGRSAGGDSGIMDAVVKSFAENFNITKFFKKGDETLKYKKTSTDIRQFNAYPAGGGDR